VSVIERSTQPAIALVDARHREEAIDFRPHGLTVEQAGFTLAMYSSGFVIIDDVDTALALMTELGRDVTSAAVAAVRTAVLNYAVRRKWYMLPHRAYVEWASEIIGSEGRHWLVLDPLFRVAAFGERARSVRLSRRFDNSQTIVVRRYMHREGGIPLDLPDIAGDVGLVDDAAASGMTLRYVARLVMQAGGTVQRILLAASSRDARRTVFDARSMVRWQEYMPGDWQALHLRDACPHLPHSGRPTGQAPVTALDGTAVEVRIQSSAVQGNPWQALCMDAAVSNSVTMARVDIARRLSVALGRPACVRDLCFLGPDVPAVVSFGQTVSGEDTLESLLESAIRR
jgi:hypothetical protein